MNELSELSNEEFITIARDEFGLWDYIENISADSVAYLQEALKRISATPEEVIAEAFEHPEMLLEKMKERTGYEVFHGEYCLPNDRDETVLKELTPADLKPDKEATNEDKDITGWQAWPP